jgi:hypothetical protein
MWVCAKCGEPHEDHFKICWKCASQEMPEQVTADAPLLAPATDPDPRLRSGGSILVRIAIAFVVGAILGGAASNVFTRGSMPEDTMGIAVAAGSFALASGLGLAIVTGIFFWVIFPYEPTAARNALEKKDVQGDSPS